MEWKPDERLAPSEETIPLAGPLYLKTLSFTLPRKRPPHQTT